MKVVAARTSRNLMGRLKFPFSSLIQEPFSKDISKKDYALQFSKSKLTDFGQLPHGQIPDALKVSRPLTYRKLPNGVRVCTESWLGPLASITVIVKAGSRNETLETSSVSNFVAQLLSKGTTNNTKEQFEQKLDSIGGSLQSQVTREATKFTVTFAHDKLEEAVKLLHDAVSNSVFDEQQVEAEKDSLYKKATCTLDPKRLIIENVHYTSFRDHFMGQPVAGIRQNIQNITAEQVRRFHKQFYVGSNIVVSAAGNVNPEKFADYVSSTFGTLQSSGSGDIKNTEQPYFTPSLMFLRDDELANVSTGVAFLAPGFTHPDFFGMKFLKRVLGKYRVDSNTGAHLNTSCLQYNTLHQHLGDYPDIVCHEPFYQPYSDVGLFGNFLFGNEVFNHQLLLLSQAVLTEFANRIAPVEVFRARAKFFNDLLSRNSSANVSTENAFQATYLDRVVSRTEVATKVTHMDPAYISRLVTKWFWDKDIAVVAWGPTHNVMTMAHYNRPYKRSTLGENGSYFSFIV